MQFPFYLDVLGYHVHPHPTFEAIGYAVGLYLILKLRARRGDRIPNDTRWWVIAAAMVGGALGSKALYWFEDPAALRAHWNDPAFLMAGKTVVGGLLGGLIGVEIVKRLLGEQRSTGDLLAIPLAAGIAIGRIGCFLTGLSDRTYGNPTLLPWGLDFGDGVFRHPTQLYEIVFLIGLTAVLTRMMPRREGDLFKAFMVAYLGFRLVIDMMKPDVRIALGLSAIQWACVAGLLYYARVYLKSGAAQVEANVSSDRILADPDTLQNPEPGTTPSRGRTPWGPFLFVLAALVCLLLVTCGGSGNLGLALVLMLLIATMSAFGLIVWLSGSK